MAMVNLIKMNLDKPYFLLLNLPNEQLKKIDQLMSILDIFAILNKFDKNR